VNFEIEQIDAQTWTSTFSQNAHRIAFGEIREPDKERIDYALLIASNGIALGYMTCRELDSKAVYWQYGGAFPSVEKTVHALPAYKALRDWHLERYDVIGTLIENTNFPMLKMAQKVGFLITGIRVFNGKILLEHTLKKGV
jgi:hypothetical protein